jgi:hypothetical protein
MNRMGIRPVGQPGLKIDSSLHDVFLLSRIKNKMNGAIANKDTKNFPQKLFFGGKFRL